MTPLTAEQRQRERRRHDWQQNDRRQSWPWVMDINDRRSGFDRRLEERRAMGGNSPLLGTSQP